MYVALPGFGGGGASEESFGRYIDSRRILMFPSPTCIHLRYGTVS